ncbi:MAG: 2-oxo acid dehydrogenase subunit E2, partial [Anaerolineae bacterium]|nr:2-oxo acid dehydrogenase subunit E2 [Anaerolineae bacterium]
IIPQPNVAILSVGAITKRPWVIEGPGGDAIGVRHIMMTSLSFDHRLVDGAQAAKFQVRLKQLLEGFDVSSL